MKKTLLFLILIGLSLSGTAQKKYYFGFAWNTVHTNIDGKIGDYEIVTSVEPGSPADKSGLQLYDIFISRKPSSDNSTLTYRVKRVGNRGTVDVTIRGVEISHDSYVTEAQWATIGLGDGQYDLYSTQKTLRIEPIQVYADPEVSLYSYASYDFEFSGNNTLQQKEIASYLEPYLSDRGLARDKENPEMIILIDFYSNRYDQYVPPTQRVITRYKYGYEYGLGWGTRRYTESETEGDYTKTEFLTSISITMLDSRRMGTGSKENPSIWSAVYDVRYSKKAELKDFAQTVGVAMLSSFPIKIKVLEQNRYWGIGVIFGSKNGVIAAVLPGSPAQAAGLEAGDQLLKANPGSSRFPCQLEKLQQKLGEKKHHNYADFAIRRCSNTTYDYAILYEWISKMYLSLTHDSEYRVDPLIKLTVKKQNGMKKTISVKPIRYRCLVLKL